MIRNENDNNTEQFDNALEIIKSLQFETKIPKPATLCKKSGRRDLLKDFNDPESTTKPITKTITNSTIMQNEFPSILTDFVRTYEDFHGFKTK